MKQDRKDPQTANKHEMDVIKDIPLPPLPPLRRTRETRFNRERPPSPNRRRRRLRSTKKKRQAEEERDGWEARRDAHGRLWFDQNSVGLVLAKLEVANAQLLETEQQLGLLKQLGAKQVKIPPISTDIAHRGDAEKRRGEEKLEKQLETKLRQRQSEHEARLRVQRERFEHQHRQLRRKQQKPSLRKIPLNGSKRLYLKWHKDIVRADGQWNAKAPQQPLQLQLSQPIQLSLGKRVLPPSPRQMRKKRVHKPKARPITAHTMEQINRPPNRRRALETQHFRHVRKQTASWKATEQASMAAEQAKIVSEKAQLVLKEQVERSAILLMEQAKLSSAARQKELKASVQHWAANVEEALLEEEGAGAGP